MLRVEPGTMYLLHAVHTSAGSSVTLKLTATPIETIFAMTDEQVRVATIGGVLFIDSKSRWTPDCVGHKVDAITIKQSMKSKDVYKTHFQTCVSSSLSAERLRSLCRRSVLDYCYINKLLFYTPSIDSITRTLPRYPTVETLRNRWEAVRSSVMQVNGFTSDLADIVTSYEDENYVNFIKVDEQNAADDKEIEDINEQKRALDAKIYAVRARKDARLLSVETHIGGQQHKFNEEYVRQQVVGLKRRATPESTASASASGLASARPAKRIKLNNTRR